jgi:microcystin degradation protein MlrC
MLASSTLYQGDIMPRVLIAEIKQETATFNPMPTCYDDFQVYEGDALLRALRGTRTEIGGALDIFSEDTTIEVVPTVSATSVSGGYIVTTDLDRLLKEIVDAVRCQHEIDAAYICLHGAMAGAVENDPEGRLMTDIRDVLGDIPLVASLDLHAVITDRLVAAADVLVPFHTYPHIDQYETGQRAANNLLKLMNGDTKPTTVRVEIPMLVRGDELITATGTFGEAIRMCQAIEESDGGLAAGVIIGNAFTDVPALQSNVLVTTDNDHARAESEALRIARFMWRHRELFQAELTSLSDAIRIAEETDGLTVFSDAADATASGAAGDSNAILKGLLAEQFAKPALVPIVDARAAAAALTAGVGEQVTVSLGGTRDPGRFTPLEISATVKSLHDGEFHYENGTVGHAGNTAVLGIGSIDILVTERSVYVVGQKVFLAHGLNPQDYSIVVVKSPNGFRPYYEEIAARIVPVDVPGSTSANLKSLPFENCVRPIFPLDDNAVPSFELDEEN